MQHGYDVFGVRRFSGFSATSVQPGAGSSQVNVRVVGDRYNKSLSICPIED